MAETLPGPVAAQSNALLCEEGNSPHLADSYDFFTTWSYPIHIYFF